jgi:hypothetical protein
MMSGFNQVMLEIEDEAYALDTLDANAARYYHAARTVDLRRWLGSWEEYADAHPEIGAWEKGRRVRQMQAELAVRDAELCRRDDHDHFGFGTEQGEDAAGHVAAHLAELRASK